MWKDSIWSHLSNNENEPGTLSGMGEEAENGKQTEGPGPASLT